MSFRDESDLFGGRHQGNYDRPGPAVARWSDGIVRRWLDAPARGATRGASPNRRNPAENPVVIVGHPDATFVLRERDRLQIVERDGLTDHMVGSGIDPHNPGGPAAREN